MSDTPKPNHDYMQITEEMLDDLTDIIAFAEIYAPMIAEGSDCPECRKGAVESRGAAERLKFFVDPTGFQKVTIQ